jgi:hydroxyethylthiazole kinase-like uncharacterized protein yjeF
VKRLLTAAEMRAVDAASADFGVPPSVLMENAGQALARAAVAAAAPSGRFLIICGTGNNGGDGLVAARALHAMGHPVFVEVVGSLSALQGEPARHADTLRTLGVGLSSSLEHVKASAGDVVIDALFGTGLSRAPEGAAARAIERIARWRAAGAQVVSADLPSGLQSDTGAPLTPHVTADVTTAFGLLKVGQALEPGVGVCGRLELVDIGLPQAAESVLSAPVAWLVEEGDAAARLPRRRPDSHKGTYGHVLVIAGSPGKTGAAALAGLAALRGGAGLVTVATRLSALDGVLRHAPELMGVPLAGERPLALADLPALLAAAAGKSAVVLGPGLHRGPETGPLIASLLEAVEVPCLLDADALNALDGNLQLLRRARGGLLLTPHPGEMARLLALPTAEVQRDRLGAARRAAGAARAVVALKGARTIISLEDGTVFINPTGNPGMATGGTGDVLAGLCGALLAQGLSVADAAVTGCFAHGLAGDLVAKRRGQLGLIASDLLDGLGEVWLRWGR